MLDRGSMNRSMACTCKQVEACGEELYKELITENNISLISNFLTKDNVVNFTICIFKQIKVDTWFIHLKGQPWAWRECQSFNRGVSHVTGEYFIEVHYRVKDTELLSNRIKYIWTWNEHLESSC